MKSVNVVILICLIAHVNGVLVKNKRCEDYAPFILNPFPINPTINGMWYVMLQYEEYSYGEEQPKCLMQEITLENTGRISMKIFSPLQNSSLLPFEHFQGQKSTLIVISTDYSNTAALWRCESTENDVGSYHYVWILSRRPTIDNKKEMAEKIFTNFQHLMEGTLQEVIQDAKTCPQPTTSTTMKFLIAPSLLLLSILLVF